MNILGYALNGGHTYSFVFLRPGKRTVGNTFASRNLANEEMYKMIKKYDLKVSKVYEDHHDKTYICSDGSSFVIDRAF